MIGHATTCILPNDLFSKLEVRYGGPDQTRAVTIPATPDAHMHRGDGLCTEPDHQQIIRRSSAPSDRKDGFLKLPPIAPPNAAAGSPMSAMAIGQSPAAKPPVARPCHARNIAMTPRPKMPERRLDATPARAPPYDRSPDTTPPANANTRNRDNGVPGSSCIAAQNAMMKIAPTEIPTHCRSSGVLRRARSMEAGRGPERRVRTAAPRAPAIA